MTPKQQLEAIESHEYEFEEVEGKHRLKLFEGVSDEELADLKRKLPGEYLPPDIEELLRYARGFEFPGLGDVRFDMFGEFGFENVFPYSAPLLDDYFGNFWIVDVDSAGGWNCVYYACHDPAVVVKQAENLTEFIAQLDEYGANGDDSTISIVHDQRTRQLWNDRSELPESDPALADLNLADLDVPDKFVVANLIDAPIKSGFAWAISGANTTIVRPTDDPFWILEARPKRGVFSRLFGK